MSTKSRAEYRSFARRFEERLDDDIARIRVPILVLGPSIKGKRLKPPARLRRVLLERCPQYGVTVLGEHKSLVRAAKRATRRGHNLCNYEVELALDCELIVIIPASPGSFAEFGLFALQEKIADKSLVLFDKSYMKRGSFLRDGPRKAYDDGKGHVVYVNYKKKGYEEAVWEKVEEHIQLAKQRIRHRQLTAGRT